MQMNDLDTMDLENRIRNLLWTVSGDYSIEMKPDIPLFLRSRAIGVYDAILQGALSRYFDRDALGMYLVKKVFLHADEERLTALSRLCIQQAVCDRLKTERPGVGAMERAALEDILEQEYGELPEAGDSFGQLRLRTLSARLQSLSGKEAFTAHEQEESLRMTVGQAQALLQTAGSIRETGELIALIDRIYNGLLDSSFSERGLTLEQVLAVSHEDLTSFDWQDYLSEELYEDALEAYLAQLSAGMTRLEDEEVTKAQEEEREKRRTVRLLTPEMLEKSYHYVELNFGRSYLRSAEEQRLNNLLCRGPHADCSLFFTEGILKNPVKRNYQYEYAIRLKKKNLWLFHDRYRLARQNIEQLGETMKKTLLQRSENLESLSDRGRILPARLWRVGRSRESWLFLREQTGDSADFVVDILIDASGSQRNRQGEVALQAYMISAALSRVGIPHRVMSYCTFWDYTVLQRFREYEDPPSKDEEIFDYVTSSNNRDGLAIRAAGAGLLARPEEHRILIVLSDGRPYDAIVNRPGARNPKTYSGEYAVADTAASVRRLRAENVRVLGVFAGEEKDLAAERKIFGRDFAYIRSIENFSKVVGRYLRRQMETE